MTVFVIRGQKEGCWVVRIFAVTTKRIRTGPVWQGNIWAVVPSRMIAKSIRQCQKIIEKMQKTKQNKYYSLKTIH